MTNELNSTVDAMRAIDMRRRRDLARGVAKHALRLFLRREELRESIGASKKTAQSKWYWIVGGVGVALHYLFAAESEKLSGWLLMPGAAYLHYLGLIFDQYSFGKELRAVQRGLGELEVQWIAATGQDTFWDLQNRLDPKDEWETEKKFVAFIDDSLAWLEKY